MSDYIHAETQDAIRLRGLFKSYSGFTLENINLTLPQGYIMGLIGENGAGKSTLIRLMLGLCRPDSGTSTLLGEDSGNLSDAVKESIGVVMDECCFPENLSARDAGKFLKRIYKTWDPGRYQQMLTAFALPPDKAVKDFSRGMKMKLSIAVALSHESRLLILDEATSGLDPVVREEILDVFLDFVQDERHSVLISSHILSDLEKICDYVTFLHQGKLLLSQSKDSLMEAFSVVKCSREQLEELEPSGIIGLRENQFGVEALVKREWVPNGLTADPATMEDIMLYHIRGTSAQRKERI